MIHKIKNHPITRHTKRIISFKLKLILFVLLPVVVFTLFTSRTDLIPGIKSFVVLTGSMEPGIPVGSIVYTQKQLNYSTGDIISFSNSDGQTVTHRIVKQSESGFVTKGDANDVNDQSSVNPDSVIGSVVFSVPHVGKVMNFLRTPMGFVLLVIVPSVIFIISELWNIKKELEKEIEKKLLKKLESTA